MAENFQILGLNEAYKMMESLTSKEKQKVILGVLRKAANRHVKAKLESSNPNKASKSRKGKPFITTNDKSNPLGILSGVSGKFFHYRFTEFGTKARYTKPYKTKTSYLAGRRRKTKVKKAVVYRGIMKARQINPKIIEESIKPVVDFFISDYGRATKKTLDRLARKKA